MRICYYNLELFKPLLEFMIKEYPNRDSRYLEWWLKRVGDTSKDKFSRTFVIKKDEQIVGCTTANWGKMIINNRFHDFYWAGNTIISSQYRGKGIGRLLYEERDKYFDRCSTGFTDIAHKIEFKISKNIKKISQVGVYLSFTRYCYRTFLDKLFGKDLINKELYIPISIFHKGVEAKRVDKIEDFLAPNNGVWMKDDVEVVRDKDFVDKRFFDIYRSYTLYQLFDKSNVIGFFVVRRAKYKNLNLLSLVDYRLTEQKYHKTLIQLVTKITKLNKIGIIITLTSQKDFFRISPLTIKTPKVLYGGTTMPELIDGQDFLITSADADLDFVYYK